MFPALSKVYAQWGPPDSPVPGEWVTGGLSGILEFAANIVFYVGLALAIIFMILSGIKWVTAGGDVKAAEAAKKQLTNTVIGLIIITGTSAILHLIVGLLGGEIPQLFIPIR